MQTELRITLQGLPHSDALDEKIREKVAKLEGAFPRLTSCHVVLSKSHHHRQSSLSYAIRMSIAFPGGDVVVSLEDRGNVYELLRNVCAAMERELERKRAKRQAKTVPHHGFSPEQAFASGDAESV
jgi:putative sigma-54 modulation protein